MQNLRLSVLNPVTPRPIEGAFKATDDGSKLSFSGSFSVTIESKPYSLDPDYAFALNPGALFFRLSLQFIDV